MPSTAPTCAASTLLARLFVESPTHLHEVSRTRLSVHYETGACETGTPEVPMLSVCTSGAVRLPNSLLVESLPQPGPAAVSRRGFHTSGRIWALARWWNPPRPRVSWHPRSVVPDVPDDLDVPSAGFEGPLLLTGYDDLSPASLIGLGPGLTPAGDDVVAGALVTAYALTDPRRHVWAEQTRAALPAHRTTAVSCALLHHAIDGYGTPQLVSFIDALTAETLTSEKDVEAARHALLAVGHSSGAALLAGVVHVITTQDMQGAA